VVPRLLPAGTDAADALSQALLVQPRPEILQYRIRPAVGGGQRPQQSRLTGKVTPLVAAGNPCIQQGGTGRRANS